MRHSQPDAHLPALPLYTIIQIQVREELEADKHCIPIKGIKKNRYQ
jgi:hypothetical protein